MRGGSKWRGQRLPFQADELGYKLTFMTHKKLRFVIGVYRHSGGSS